MVKFSVESGAVSSHHTVNSAKIHYKLMSCCGSVSSPALYTLYVVLGDLKHV